MTRVRILLLGGTDEARRIAEEISNHSSIGLTVSLAGASAAPRPYPAPTRIGGFGGAAGMAAWMTRHEIDALIDATHPFATQIKANAACAAAATGAPALHVLRPAWRATPQDQWIDAPNLAAAAAVPPAGASVFLAVGRDSLPPLAARSDVTWIARVLSRADAAARLAPSVLARVALMEGAPSPSIADEIATLRRVNAQWVVAKNSGGRFGWGKIAAARALNLPVVMIARPPAPKGAMTEDWRDAVIFGVSLTKTLFGDAP